MVARAAFIVKQRRTRERAASPLETEGCLGAGSVVASWACLQGEQAVSKILHSADDEQLPPRRGSGYPKPYDGPCAEREKRALGDAFGLTDYGVNLVTLPPGAWSSQRHWHSAEDELVFVLEGEPTLVTDEGRRRMRAGMCAGFPKGEANGHHLVNETGALVVYLEVGSRRADDDVDYPDIDMRVAARGRGGVFTRKDGTPYDV